RRDGLLWLRRRKFIRRIPERGSIRISNRKARTMSKRSHRFLWLGALALAGCGGGTQAPEKGEKSPLQSPFDALRVIHTALEQSPDNLPARARALIEAKDPDAIFRFVRDEIAVYP